jgi:undecaprenyl phosphate-alpha-L-ara4FN deformylase
MALEIALKVDVCNRRSLEQGVPGLLGVLAEFGVKASFFVAFGPDNSGRAIRRIFRRGFIQKMIRTRAPSVYGFKTLFYGTLLPAPAVGEAMPQLLRSMTQAGHEVGLHGWDHVGWHDGVARMDFAEIRESLGRAVRLFEQGMGCRPLFSGAPGWQVTAQSLRAQEEHAFVFSSDCRGEKPFYPAAGGASFRTLQIPTTLPTSDELLGAEGMNEQGLPEYFLIRLREDRVNVLGLHAEFEGIQYRGWLRTFLAACRRRGVRFALLSDIARRYAGLAPVHQVVEREIPGRAGTVAWQKVAADRPVRQSERG